MRETLKIEPWQVHSADWPLYEHEVHDRGPQFALALETWLFGESVARARLVAWLGERLVESLTTCNILAAAGSDVQAQVQLLPFAEFCVAGDADEGVREPDVRVFNVAPSSVRLARTLPRDPVGHALDLGAGAGVLALVLSRRSPSVTAVDRSSAALSLARSNMLLNGAGNVDVRHGDWFSGLDGQRFSVIAANLPYTVSPGGSSAFDDSGLPGDSVSYRVLDDAHRYLESDGRAYILCSWTLSQGWGRRCNRAGDATARAHEVRRRSPLPSGAGCCNLREAQERIPPQFLARSVRRPSSSLASLLWRDGNRRNRLGPRRAPATENTVSRSGDRVCRCW